MVENIPIMLTRTLRPHRTKQTEDQHRLFHLSPGTEEVYHRHEWEEVSCKFNEFFNAGSVPTQETEKQRTDVCTQGWVFLWVSSGQGKHQREGSSR